MFVDHLALVVVFGALLTMLLRDGLGRFVSLETAEELLFAICFGRVAQAAVGKHQRVVSLYIFGVNGEHLFEGGNGLGILPLQE
ncbi:MAG: hypothetical protein B7X34_10615, partial [Acidobacteriia bacterium 12-62-4]